MLFLSHLIAKINILNFNKIYDIIRIFLVSYKIFLIILIIIKLEIFESNESNISDNKPEPASLQKYTDAKKIYVCSKPVYIQTGE